MARNGPRPVGDRRGFDPMDIDDEWDAERDYVHRETNRRDDQCCASIGRSCRPKNWMCSIITWLFVLTALGLGIAAMIQINALDDHRLPMRKIAGTTDCSSPASFVNGVSDELFTLYNACTEEIYLPGMTANTALPIAFSAICYGLAIGGHHCVPSSIS
jgi:hypothetical protein